MENAMKYACGQINCTKDIETNVAYIRSLIDYGISIDADFCVTPEYALSGFVDHIDDWPEKFDECLEDILSYAKENEIGLFLGTLYPVMDKFSNQVRVYDKEGSILGVAKKIRCWGQLEVPNTLDEEGIGNNIIDMPNGDRVAVIICNDMWGNGIEEGLNIPRTSQGMGARSIVHITNAERGFDHSKDRTLRSYHNAWLQVVSLDVPVISVDNACNMNGEPYYGDTSSQSGFLYNGNYIYSAAPRGVDYFSGMIGQAYQEGTK